MTFLELKVSCRFIFSRLILTLPCCGILLTLPHLYQIEDANQRSDDPAHLKPFHKTLASTSFMLKHKTVVFYTPPQIKYHILFGTIFW